MLANDTLIMIHLTDAAVRSQVDAVLADDLYWFPVRHHSPAAARYVESAIRARRPRVVFIEGPAEANHLLPHLLDAKTKPPIAIYSSYRDDDNVLGLAGIASPAAHIPARFSCWYPLLAYSPEYLAIKTAQEVGARVVFIDLPHHALIEGSGKEPRATPRAAEIIVESSFYKQLAAAAGYRSWDEAWDTLFEVRDFGDDAEAYRREMATFCCAARLTTTAERIDGDGTRERERHMLHTIRSTMKADKLKPGQAFVVCGGFHLFLDRDDVQPPPEPPAGTVYTTVVPYSYFRVSQLAGYGAGNRAPRFYQHLWEATRAGRPGDLLIEHVIAVLKQGRLDGEALSSADAIAVCQHAGMLARLRGRPLPVLDDIHDALITCCCKGDPREEGRHLQKAIDAVDIGSQLGKVTPALGQLPIIDDFHRQIERLKLEEVMSREKRLAVVLDKRQEDANEKSIFLHRLRFLGIPFAELAEAPTGDFATGTLFREKWALKWNPKVEAELVELNLYGDTVETAALAKLREQLAEDDLHAGNTCRRLVQAIDMALPDLVNEARTACGAAIDADSRFASLTDALASLSVLDRYAAFRNLRRDTLETLIVRCYDRACFAMLDVVNAPDDQQAEVVRALLGLADVMLKGDRQGLDRLLFTAQLHKAAGLTQVPFLRGVFLGMLAELREIDAGLLAAEISALARSPAEHMVTAGDLVDGVMAVSRTSIMLGADALIAAIDELLKAAEWEPFLMMLPRLRAAFERLHEGQRDSLAGLVAERYGLAERESLRELTVSVAAAALMVDIDRQVARIMKHWEFR